MNKMFISLGKIEQITDQKTPQTHPANNSFEAFGIHAPLPSNTGMFFGAIFLDPYASENLLNHESGHGRETEELNLITWLTAIAGPSLFNSLGSQHFGNDWLFLTAPYPHTAYNQQRHEVPASTLGGVPNDPINAPGFYRTMTAQITGMQYFDRLREIDQLSGLEFAGALAEIGIENIVYLVRQFNIATGRASYEDCEHPSGAWAPECVRPFEFSGHQF